MTVSKIIGPSGADYATPALWFASFAATLLDDQVGNCQNAEIVVTATQALSGVDVSGFSILLTAGSGNSFVDHVDKLTNALRYNASNGAAIRMSSGAGSVFSITCANFGISRLQVKKDGDYDSVIDFIGADAGRSIDKSIIFHSGWSGVVLYMRGAAVLTNSVVYTDDLAHGISSQGGNCGYQNVTIVTNSAGTGKTGFIQGYGAPTLRNVVVAGFATDYSGTGGTCANNATDKGSFGGTNYGTSGQVSVVQATEWENVGGGTEDYRVKTSSAKLKDNGTASGTPAVDIVGQTRSGTPTIGAWEVAGAGVPASRKSWIVQ